MRRQLSMYERFLQAAEKTGDITLRYQFQKEMMKASLLDRHEREKLKAEITEDIMSRISISLNEQAIKQLDKMLRELGK